VDSGKVRRGTSAALCALLALTPALVLPFTAYPAVANIFGLGLLVASVAAPAGRMVLVGWCTLTVAVAAAIGVGLSSTPIGGAVLFVVLSGLLAVSATRGWHLYVLYVPIAVGFVMVAPPSITGGIGQVEANVTVGYCLGVGLIIGVACLWGGLLLVAAAHLLGIKPDLFGYSRYSSLGYGSTLAWQTGLSAYVVLAWIPGSQAGWILMTELLLIRPRAIETLHRAWHRVAGTIIGVGVAAAVAAWMPLPKVQLGLAVTLLAIATVLSTTAPYWVYVAIITPGAVMFASQGNDTLGVDYLRLAYTLVAVGLVVVTALLGRLVWRRLNPTAQRRADEEHKAIVAARSRRGTQSGSGPIRRDDTQ